MCSSHLSNLSGSKANYVMLPCSVVIELSQGSDVYISGEYDGIYGSVDNSAPHSVTSAMLRPT